MDDGWKRVWAEMTDTELEDRLFTYLWLSVHTPNKHAGRIAQLIDEAERRGQSEMVERTRAKAQRHQLREILSATVRTVRNCSGCSATNESGVAGPTDNPTVTHDSVSISGRWKFGDSPASGD